MMLFNAYNSSEMQLLFDVVNTLRYHKIIKKSELHKMCDAASIPYKDFVKRWCVHSTNEDSQPEILQHTSYNDADTYALNEFYSAFHVPLNQLEWECLSNICATDEASLFLPHDLQQKLASDNKGLFACIVRQNALGKKREIQQVDSTVFQTLLLAISNNQTVRYTYQTKDNPMGTETVQIPYKLEYQVYDGRWWLIVYDRSQKRTIKAKLSNITSVQRCEKHTVSQTEIEDAVNRLLAPTPVVLHLKREKNAWERCFITFEDMHMLEARQLDAETVELSFRYFRFDVADIVKKLLYLGEYVTVQSPEDIKCRLVTELRKALVQNAIKT